MSKLKPSVTEAVIIVGVFAAVQIVMLWPVTGPYLKNAWAVAKVISMQLVYQDRGRCDFCKDGADDEANRLYITADHGLKADGGI